MDTECRDNSRAETVVGMQHWFLSITRIHTLVNKNRQWHYNSRERAT
jgi:hypothetical protein